MSKPEKIRILTFDPPYRLNMLKKTKNKTKIHSIFLPVITLADPVSPQCIWSKLLHVLFPLHNFAQPFLCTNFSTNSVITYIASNPCHMLYQYVYYAWYV